MGVGDHVASSPGFFNVYERKRGRLGSNNVGMTSWKRGGQQLSISNRSTYFSLSNTVIWGFQGPYDSRLKAAPSEALENMARPHAISTPLYGAYVTRVTLDLRLPLFLLCTFARIMKALKCKHHKPVLWAWKKYAYSHPRTMLSGRRQQGCCCMHIRCINCRPTRDCKSQRAKETQWFFVKRCPFSECIACWWTCQEYLCPLSTENVKPSQGKQIMPYLLNETFLEKSEIIENSSLNKSCCR